MNSLPYQPHSDTSRAAAKKARQIAPKARRVALWLIEQAGEDGMTDNELIAAMVERGYQANGPRARRIELVRADLVADSDRRRNGSTVWIAKGQPKKLF